MESITVRIPERLRARIKRRAKDTQHNESEVLRAALEQGIEVIDPQPHGLDMLASIGAHGGPTDLALNHDEYLYGDKA